MDPSIIDCHDQLVLRPSVTRVDGRPILTKTPAVATAQGMAPVIEMVLRDGEGRPINFSTCGFDSASSSSSSSLSGTVKLRAREILSNPSTAPLIDVEGIFTNAAAGVVRAKMPVEATGLNGILEGNWGVFSSSGELIHSTNFYILIERSQFNTTGVNGLRGLPAVREIRLYLRDSSPEDNPLLNTLEFDLSEICEVMVQCVQHWNTSQPKINRFFNTTNFPNPTVLFDGIMGELYILAAKHYRRNQLAYNAGGIAVDDKNKAQEYEAIGNQMLQEYMKWVKMTKVQINKEAWDGSFGSTYGEFGRYR